MAAVWIFVSIRLAAFIVIFGAFGLFMIIQWRPRLLSLFVFFFILAGYEAIALEAYLVAAFGAETDIDNLDAANEHHGASVFEFSNGAVKLGKVGKSSMVGKVGDSRSGGSFSFVAPFVSDDWKESDPVTVWATCSRTDAGIMPRVGVNACGDFGTSSMKAVAEPRSGFFRAIDNAIAAHDLREAENALLVRFVPDPTSYIESKSRVALWLPVLFNGLFIAAILITALLKKT